MLTLTPSPLRKRNEAQTYLAVVEKLRKLDLSDVLSARLLCAQEGCNPSGAH